MSDLQTTRINRPPAGSWLPRLGWLVSVLLALVVLKPWDWGIAGLPEPTVSHPTARPIRTDPPTDRTAYDPRLFGLREPDPAWELWPAGYVFQFGLAGPVAVSAPGASPEPASSAATSPSPSAGATSGPVAGSPLPAPGPTEYVVDLGSADHLIALGINMPADVRVIDVSLWVQLGPECCTEEVRVIRLPTLWESRHFIVIGVADPSRPGKTGPWVAGEYRLDLGLAGGETRSVRLRVTASLD